MKWHGSAGRHSDRSRIHQEANRLTALVQDIIQLSKLEEGTSQMQEEVVDLYELTEDIGATLHHAAKKKDNHDENQKEQHRKLQVCVRSYMRCCII